MNILSLSGLIPEQICDTVRFIRYPGRRSIAHYCGYAADFISRVLDDPSIDGCVFPRTCDSTRVMGSYLAGCGKFVHQMHIPARRDSMAAAYLARSIREYRQAVEAYYGVTLDDVPRRAAMIALRDRALAGLYASLPEISYSAWLDMLHDMLQKPLAEQTVPDSLPAGRGGKPVYLVGSTMCSAELARAIEAAGMRVVGDRLTESRRLFSVPPVAAEGDIYENIARSMLQNLASPTQNDFASILREDLAELESKAVRGVIFVTQKYCEPYDYLYSAYRKMLDERSIPTLRLKAADSTDTGRAETAIETFADIL